MDRKLFESMAPEMWRKAIDMACRMRVPLEEAEDLAQEAMIKLWMVHDDIADARSIMGLLIVVVRRMIIDRYRRRRDMDALSEKLPDETQPSPLEEMIGAERLRALQQRIDALPRTEYMIIMLRAREDIDNASIARLLGIKPDSVRALLSRSRRRLLEQFTPAK